MFTKSNLDNLNERLTTKQLHTYYQDMGFGLELEMQITASMRNKFDACTRLLPDDNYNNYRDYDDETDHNFAWVFIGELAGYSPARFADDTFFCSAKKISEKLGLDKATVLKALTDIHEVLNSNDSVHVGEYGSGRSESSWRVESDGSLDEDYGVEIITANINKKGMPYAQVMTQVPKLCKALSIFGFKGIKNTTGLHIHISSNKKVTVNAFKNFIETNKDKYTLFSLISYLTNQESEGYLQQGDYDRKSNSYSQAFINLIYRTFLHFPKNYWVNILESLVSIVEEHCHGESNKQILLSKSIFKLITNTSEPGGLEQRLDHYAKEEFDDITQASHHVDYSARTATIENRMLGGAAGFDAMLDPKKLDLVLKLAVNQVYPYLDEKPLDVNKVIRSAEIVLRESVLPLLNMLFNRINKVTSFPDYTNRLTAAITETVDDNFRAVGGTIGAVVREIIETNERENNKYDVILNNKVVAVELSKSNRTDKAIVVKNYKQSPANSILKPHRIGGFIKNPSRIKDTKAVDSSYDVDSKYVPRFREVNISLTGALPDIEPAEVLINRKGKIKNIPLDNAMSTRAARADKLAIMAGELPKARFKYTKANPNKKIKAENVSSISFDPKKHNLKFDPYTDLVVHLAPTRSEKGYFYIKFMSKLIKKDNTVSFEYGSIEHSKESRYRVAFPNENLASSFYNKLTKLGVSIAPAGYIKRLTYLPGTTDLNPNRPRYKDAAEHGPSLNTSSTHKYAADESGVPLKSTAVVHHLANGTVEKKDV